MKPRPGHISAMRGATLALAIAALAAALLGGALLYRSMRATTNPPSTEEERMALAVEAFLNAHNRMTPDRVRHLFGEPDEVFRDNPRALCWAYATPYEIRMCWGPNRQAAWIAHNIPRDEVRGSTG
jgi:hypothetical protein